MKFPLSEIFSSIQGEGPYSGRQCTFLRLSGCNLRCKFGDNLCDTPYTSWFPESKQVELNAVVAEVIKLAAHSKLVIITGGEPTIIPGLKPLCQELKKRGFELHIETNGTGSIPSEIDVIICSPKLSDSRPVDTEHLLKHDRERIRLNTELHGSDPRLYLKFVVTHNTDIEEVSSVVQRLAVAKNRVYLMPEGLSADQVMLLSPHVWKLAMENGYNFTSRLHVLNFGNKRGV